MDGGDGVYNARVMLDLPIDYFGVTSSSRLADFENSDDSTSATPSQIKIFPNPASETVNLEIEIQDGQKVNVEIFDLNGKLVIAKQLEPQQRLYMLDTHSLLEGVYLLRLILNGEAIESKRLVIIK